MESRGARPATGSALIACRRFSPVARLSPCATARSVQNLPAAEVKGELAATFAGGEQPAHQRVRIAAVGKRSDEMRAPLVIVLVLDVDVEIVRRHAPRANEPNR